MKPFHNKIARTIALVVRMALGALFIASAIAKLVDIDRFEIYVFSYHLLPLNLSFLSARLVIVAEMLVGIGLLSNIWKRFVDICATLMLTLFTVLLCFAALQGRTDNCQCFGSLLEIDPLHSILKNALLILALLVAMGARPWPWNPRWWLWVPVVLTPFVVVFVRSAPDNWLFGPSQEVYNVEDLDKALQSGGDLHGIGLQEGRHVVAFLSPKCPFCHMADEKLTHICRRNHLDSTAFVYLIPSTDSTLFIADSSTGDLPMVPMDSTSFLRPGHLIPSLTFAYITYGQRPMVFLMEDGLVTVTCHYRNIDERQIVDFLTPDHTK